MEYLAGIQTCSLPSESKSNNFVPLSSRTEKLSIHVYTYTICMNFVSERQIHVGTIYLLGEKTNMYIKNALLLLTYIKLVNIYLHYFVSMVCTL